MIPEEEEEKEQQQPDPTDQYTLVFDSEESNEEPFNTTIDTISDDSAITMGKPVTTAFISNLVHVSREQVGYLQVTSQLQEFLDQYLHKLTEKAFEHICQIVQVLDKYLVNNPKQHLHRNYTWIYFHRIYTWINISYLYTTILSLYQHFNQFYHDIKFTTYDLLKACQLTSLISYTYNILMCRMYASPAKCEAKPL